MLEVKIITCKWIRMVAILKCIDFCIVFFSLLISLLNVPVYCLHVWNKLPNYQLRSRCCCCGATPSPMQSGTRNYSLSLGWVTVPLELTESMLSLLGMDDVPSLTSPSDSCRCKLASPTPHCWLRRIATHSQKKQISFSSKLIFNI